MDDDDISIDPAIAAQMGFSSFGAKGSSTKRKYHDASFVDGQEDQDTKQKKHAGSGANNVALGQRGTGKKDIMEDNPSGSITTRAVGGSVGEGSEEKLKSGAKEKKAAPSGLAAFLSRGQTVTEVQVFTSQDRAAIEAEHGISTSTNAAKAGSTATMAATLEEPGDSRARTPNQQAYRHGIKNDQGDMAYFLPSFIEDPWKELKSAAD